MDDRKKLIEILRHNTTFDEYLVKMLAAMLTAKGVTFPKHERWEPVSLDDQYEGVFKCSGCKTERYFGAGYPSYYDGSYCPNCGARMLEDEDGR